jgi:hypothetical protein
MENLGIFYDHLVYFTAIGNILWPFGIFYGHLVYFMAIWYTYFLPCTYFVTGKIWQAWLPQKLATFAFLVLTNS